VKVPGGGRARAVSQSGWLLSRRGRSLPANAGAFDTRRDSMFSGPRYALMLEHYYGAFPPEQIRVVCTESLDNATAARETMAELASWLQLAPFDFGPAVGKVRLPAARPRSPRLPPQSATTA
jgi:hypothetical protein